MPRPHRPLAAGLIYHVTGRGNAKSPLFLSDADFEKNHYHLLVETPRANLNDAMQRLNGTYAMRFNRRYARTGHVFQGRYGAKLITDDGYALTVVQYIAANPVQAGICSAPEEWPWSSYAATAGLCPRPPFLTTRVLDWVGGPDEYRRLVLSGLWAKLDDRRSLAELLPRRDDELIAAAHEVHGYSFAEIAGHIGVHRSTVLRAIRRYASARNIGV